MSMHASASARHVPAPPRRLVTRIVIPGIILGGVVLALLWSGWGAFAPALSVNVVQVVMREGAGPGAPAQGRAVQAPGWVEPAPFPIMVSALTPGIVKEVRVLEGQRVSEGEVLVELYSEEHVIALRAAEASMLEQQAKRNEMADEHRRKKELVASGAVAQAEVTRLALRVEAMDAAIQAARAERDMRELALQRTKVVAPKAGVVMARLATPGMVTGSMQDGKPLIELYDPASLQVRADVPLADAALVAPGLQAEVRVDVLPNRAFKGTVSRMVHQADIAKNTVQAKIQILEPAPELKPDMLARVKIMTAPTGGTPTSGSPTASAPAATGSGSGGLWAPAVALRMAANASTQATVLVVTKLQGDVGVAEERTVTLAGLENDGWQAIATGLRAGDLLVSTQGAQPAPGQRVRVDWTQVRGEGDASGHH